MAEHCVLGWREGSIPEEWPAAIAALARCRVLVASPRMLLVEGPRRALEALVRGEPRWRMSPVVSYRTADAPDEEPREPPVDLPEIEEPRDA